MTTRKTKLTATMTQALSNLANGVPYDYTLTNTYSALEKRGLVRMEMNPSGLGGYPVVTDEGRAYLGR